MASLADFQETRAQGRCQHDRFRRQCFQCSPQNFCGHVAAQFQRDQGITYQYMGTCVHCCPEYAAHVQRRREKGYKR